MIGARISPLDPTYPGDCHVRPCALGWACRKKDATAMQNGAEMCRAQHEIIGQSPAVTAAVALLRKVAARGSSTVLLLGESGTGKDLFARALHCASSRASGPFVAINCAAIPDTLIESELFGHEKGAFTDARALKKGVFELACGGTLYLDEISELKGPLQAKLLGVIETMTFRRVGGERDISVSVRIVAASNRNLDAAVRSGDFREDLYYRLRVIEMRLPPLRERRSDIRLLATYFLEHLSRKFRRSGLAMSPEALERLQEYSWPGNIRELRNAIERAVILEEGDEVTTAFLPTGERPEADIPVPNGSSVVLPPEGASLEAVEASLVQQAMARAAGNQTKAAQLLGIGRDALRYKLKKFGLACGREETAGPDVTRGSAPIRLPRRVPAATGYQLGENL